MRGCDGWHRVQHGLMWPHHQVLSSQAVILLCMHSWHLVRLTGWWLPAAPFAEPPWHSDQRLSPRRLAHST